MATQKTLTPGGKHPTDNAASPAPSASPPPPVSVTFSPRAADVAAATKRIIAGGAVPAHEDLALLLSALFQGRRVSARVFPILAQDLATRDQLGKKLSLYILLLAVRRKMDIAAAVPFLQTAFIAPWEKLYFPSECGFFYVDRFLHNPPREYNQLLMQVIAEHFVRTKNPDALMALFNQHINHINRLHGIWFALPHKSALFDELRRFLNGRSLNTGPED